MGGVGRVPRGEEVVVDAVDVRALRAWLVAHAVPGVDEIEEGDDGGTTHRRRARTERGTAVLEARLPGRGDTVVLRVHAETPGAAGPGLRKGRSWLGLVDDPAPAAEALAGDALVGPLVRARPHVRVPGTVDGLETAVGVVLGQQVSVAAARGFAGRLVASHGEQARGSRLFPTGEGLARANPADLQRTIGITGARARTVVALARAVVDGLSVEPCEDPDERVGVRARLLELPGIGSWTADLIAMRCLGDPDVFPAGDLVLRRALGGVSAREATGLAEAWRPHRSLAVVHLWTRHALDPDG